MKKLTLLLSALFILASFQSADAQIWKKIKKKAEQKIEKEAEEKMDDILNGEQKKEDAPKESPGKSPEEDRPSGNENSNTPDNKNGKSNTDKSPEIWRNYKFIPGETVIFYDDLKFEEVGEFPSRWDLITGGAEVALFNNEKVIITTAKHNNRITPLFKSKNYLSDEFTIEFDIYVEASDASNFWTEIEISLQEKGLTNYAHNDIRLSLSNGKTTNGHAINTNFALENVPLGKMNDWHHIALSYHKGKFKLYYDDKRIANLPKTGFTPDAFSIGYRAYASAKKTLHTAVKNIRIAHGGGQMYKRIMADGKYVTNGILFDSGKAVIQAQSMGIINKVVTVMQENPDWKFQIIGHTDNDGSTESNLSLSQERAEAVKQAIIDQGISAERLSTLGKGENEALNTNATPEEKANNRRVEFIKS